MKMTMMGDENEDDFFVKLLRPFVSVNSDFFKIFTVLGISKIIEKIEFLTRMLQLLCAR
jgi:hypothetical protein